MPAQAAQRVGPQLNLSTLSREVNVVLLYGQYFEKEASYLSEILTGHNWSSSLSKISNNNLRRTHDRLKVLLGRSVT